MLNLFCRSKSPIKNGCKAIGVLLFMTRRGEGMILAGWRLLSLFVCMCVCVCGRLGIKLLHHSGLLGGNAQSWQRNIMQ